MNHKWKDNVCIHCGIKRIRKYWRQLMAVVNHPPWEAYMPGTDWYYTKPNETKGTFKRPDCKK